MKEKNPDELGGEVKPAFGDKDHQYLQNEKHYAKADYRRRKRPPPAEREQPGEDNDDHHRSD
jgi:hypothetical protein